MKKILPFLFWLLAIFTYSQDCSILSKANNISPDNLCSPVAVSWNVSYSGVNNNGTSVDIRYDWNDGNIETVAAVQINGIWEATLTHTYTAIGNQCNYHPLATLIVNGVECSSSSQQQIVTVWDDDDHNGGHMRIDPYVYTICFGDSADVQFRDVTQFNCVPPEEQDVPNFHTRWVQWIYGTDITFTGKPVTVNGESKTFPYSAPIITLPEPVYGSGVLSDILNVAPDKLVNQWFQVTLRNWNYCNPYDDPNIPGPPADTINGDHPPVETTAIILIVALPDATIIPMDTLCVDDNPIKLSSMFKGGIWTGPGVVGNMFNPKLAGIGNHLIRYTIINGNGCSDWDETVITVQPSPIVNINPIGTVFVNAPPITLQASVPGGIWFGSGINDSIFVPTIAGVGTHIIMYETPPDNNGCTGIDTIHIQVIMPPEPIANFNADSIGCSPLSVQFKNNSQYGESYFWDFGDNTYSTEKNPLHIFYSPGNYIVKLIVTNVAGYAIKYGKIEVYQNPVVLFDIYPTEIINNNQIIKTINNTLYSFYYLWKWGDGETSEEFQPWHKYESEGEYTISLLSKTIEGCSDSLEFHTVIKVSFNIGYIDFPNAFIWNRTGPTGGFWREGEINNNVFHPEFENVAEYKLEIFNRWGELIYTTTDIYKGWDGYTKEDNLAMQAVYVWKVTGKYINGEPFLKTGDVTFLH